MKLIFIYGPPAAGKLTVAEEISKKTGYSVFHNHLTVDLAKSLFKMLSKPYNNYCEKLRLEYITLAASNNTNIIFTFCYAPTNEDNNFVKKLIGIIKKYNGKIYFVHLHAKKEVLHQRVINSSRKKYKKINKKLKLKKVLENHNFYTKIPFVKSLDLDNTKLRPREAAKEIMRYIKT